MQSEDAGLSGSVTILTRLSESLACSVDEKMSVSLGVLLLNCSLVALRMPPVYLQLGSFGAGQLQPAPCMLEKFPASVAVVRFPFLLIVLDNLSCTFPFPTYFRYKEVRSLPWTCVIAAVVWILFGLYLSS